MIWKLTSAKLIGIVILVLKGHLHKRPIGQAVKTPPFHGGNTGSNPVWVTKVFCESKITYYYNMED